VTGAGDPARLTIEQALARLPGPDGKRFALLYTHGSLEVEVYAPPGRDDQTPHARDEIYVVMRGTGTFFIAGTRRRFGPGDFLFAAAGVEHRFEDFTDDFATWVFFYGPEGGEQDQGARAGV
jgi:mannose-6-phosphate isomerase-like protein (cupin superfamily)